jgi:hypothetical protein
VLDRAFIDDPVNGVFASDIAKSFLRDVPESRTQAGIAALADEIETGMSSSATVVLRSDAAPPRAKGPPSPGYQVYLGARPSHALTADGDALTLANELQEGKPVLRLSLSRAGAAPMCVMGKIAN